MKSTKLCTVLLLLLAMPLVAQFSDEFDTDQLNTGWRWLREEPSRWRLEQDVLILYTQPGALNGVLFNNVRNLLVQPCTPGKDFTIETELTFDPGYEFRNAGLLYYIDDDNYIRLSRGIYEGHDDIWFEWEVAGVTQFRFADAQRPLTCQLKLSIMLGGRFRGSWKLDNTDWNIFADQTIAFPAQPIMVGLQAANGDGMVASRTPISAIFEYFRVGAAVSVNPSVAPLKLTFGAPHPSPSIAGGDVAVPFTTDRVTPLRWRVTDLLGREVLRAQELGPISPGTHTLVLPMRIATPGVYLLHLESGWQRATRRIVLNRRQ